DLDVALGDEGVQRGEFAERVFGEAAMRAGAAVDDEERGGAAEVGEEIFDRAGDDGVGGVDGGIEIRPRDETRLERAEKVTGGGGAVGEEVDVGVETPDEDAVGGRTMTSDKIGYRKSGIGGWRRDFAGGE